MASRLDVVEASIADLRAALDSGRITAYDHAGIRLNSVVVMSPQARADAVASDARRASGQTRGPLDGIPYTAKDSYCARGLTVAAGSPAFAELVERCIERQTARVGGSTGSRDRLCKDIKATIANIGPVQRLSGGETRR